MEAKSRTLLNVNLRWFLVAMVLARSSLAFLGARFLNGLGVGVLMPAYDSLISKVVPENKRGLAFGFFGTLLGILSLPMPWIGAQLWKRFSPQTLFWITVVVCAISVPIAWFKFILPQIQESRANNKEPA
ncbi:MAG: MFS transporter [Chloroflexi bacterium]|nr:MFS transporter [Chloroflexota bacterium]